MNSINQLHQLTKELKVLYIEDDLVLRNTTRNMFANLFKVVDIAENGQEGWQSYVDYYASNNKYYDIVITDIKMPIMDGLELSKKILKLNQKQIIVVTSAHDESKYLIEFINININKFIVKPFSLKTIITIFLDLFEGEYLELFHIFIDEDYFWNTQSKKLFYQNNEIKLSFNECSILNVLINNQNKIFSNEDLFSIITDENFTYEVTKDTIKSAIKRLRKKLPQNIISNIYGQGYSISLQKNN